MRDGVSWRCACATGWGGATCETSLVAIPLAPPAAPPCPCASGGTCVPSPTPPGWACVCREGRTGSRCELTMDSCASSPCRNGGRCVGGAGWWACECPAGWTGDTCAIRVPAPASCSPACPSGAACVPDARNPERAARCVCPPPPQRAARRCLESKHHFGTLFSRDLTR